MGNQKQPLSIKDILHLLSIIGIAVIFILSIGAFLTLKTLTIIKCWIPLTGAFILAAISGITIWRIWKNLTRCSKFLPNYLLNLVFFTFFLCALFYTLNTLFLRSDKTHKEKVIVEEKYRERHHTSRRVGRRSYVSGPDYFTYYISFTLPEDYHCDLQLPHSVYKNIRKDSTLIISLRRGLFGLDVIQPSDIPKDNPVTYNHKNPRRCRFFGTSGKR